MGKPIQKNSSCVFGKVNSSQRDDGQQKEYLGKISRLMCVLKKETNASLLTILENHMRYSPEFTKILE